MPVQKEVRSRMRYGAAGTHVTAWSVNNAPVNTRALEMLPGSPHKAFGLGAIRGTTPGETVAVPTETFDTATFEGVIMNNFLVEHDLADGYTMGGNNAVGVCRHGDIWVQISEDVEPAYGDLVHLLFTGDNAGKFSNDGGIALTGMFTGSRTDEGIAPVELRRG